MIRRFGMRSAWTVRWKTTEKSLDVLLAIVQLMAFGARWDAENSFKDRLPRRVSK